MNFKRITYTGRKAYRDRFSGLIWAPGETKLVGVDHVRKLLKFVEFVEAQSTALAPDAAAEGQKTPEQLELEQAELAQADIDRKAREIDEAKESMLQSLVGMNKAALTEYAAKYDSALSSKMTADEMRTEVRVLVEQFGVR